MIIELLIEAIVEVIIEVVIVVVGVLLSTRLRLWPLAFTLLVSFSLLLKIFLDG